MYTISGKFLGQARYLPMDLIKGIQVFNVIHATVFSKKEEAERVLDELTYLNDKVVFRIDKR